MDPTAVRFFLTGGEGGRSRDLFLAKIGVVGPTISQHHVCKCHGLMLKDWKNLDIVTVLILR